MDAFNARRRGQDTTSNEIIEVLLLAIHPSTIPSLFGLRSRASRIEYHPASISMTIIPVIRN